ncbi:MAG: T9SS type A sorting domain-containing protein [Bacteroidia bacterium]
MKHFFTLVSCLAVLVSLQAQGTTETDYDPSLSGQSIRTANGSERMAGPIRHRQGNYSRAMWDVEFNYNAADSAGQGGQAGVIVTPAGDIWTSRWSDDTLYRYNTSGQLLGSFTITNGTGRLSGIRGMTTDGTNIYAVNNSRVVYVINPVTLAVTSQFTGTPPDDLRWITYDGSANGGAGGFWVGNFNTSLFLISRTGATLRSIAAGTHTLTGMYGAVYDGVSTGGPYLWAFIQTGGISSANIAQVDLTTGVETGILREVSADLGIEADDLAGGLCISDQVVTGETVIMGVVQGGDNNLFGYELTFAPVGVDAAVYPAYFGDTYTQIPEIMVPFTDFSVNSRMQGSQTVNGLAATFDVEDINGANVFSDQQNFTTLPSAATGLITFNSWIPSGTGVFDASITLTTTMQTDEDLSNNTLRFSRLTVSDSVLAYDDGIPNAGGYSVSGATGNASLALTRYRFPADAFIKGVQVQLVNPAHGEITYPVLVPIDVTSGEPIGSPIARGPDVVLDSTINTYFLKFDQPQRALTGDFWGVGLYEALNTRIDVAQSPGNYQAGSNFFTTNVASPNWVSSSIATNRFIRPVISTCKNFSISVTTTPDTSASGGTATVNVNDPTGRVFVIFDDPNSQTNLTATGLAAGAYRVIAADELGCTDTVDFVISASVSIDEDLISGLDVFPNPANDKVVISGNAHKSQALELALIGLDGRLLKTKKLQTAGDFTTNLSVGDLAPGAYLLRISDEQGNAQYQKLSIMR